LSGGFLEGQRFRPENNQLIMEVKTNTKEKFHVIGVAAPHLSALMAEDLCNRLQQYLQGTVRNVVVNLKDVKSLDEEAAECIVKSQQAFYEKGASFVICELTPAVEQFLDEKDLLELMNVTPTESEACDIVQMEEIERELLDDEDEP
jgi:anti-anti-sigma factor